MSRAKTAEEAGEQAMTKGVKVGRWSVSEGKNGRIYINLDNSDERIVVPEDIAKDRGLLAYSIEDIEGLAEAIIKFRNRFDPPNPFNEAVTIYEHQSWRDDECEWTERFFETEEEAKENIPDWDGEIAHQHDAIGIGNGAYLLLASTDVKFVEGSAAKQDHLRKTALAKLTDEEIKALGLERASND